MLNEGWQISVPREIIILSLQKTYIAYKVLGNLYFQNIFIGKQKSYSLLNNKDLT